MIKVMKKELDQLSDFLLNESENNVALEEKIDM